MKDSCIFYRDWFDGLQSLEPSVKAELLEGILLFALYGTEPELSPTAQSIFGFLRPKIERDGVKYEEIKEKRSEAGKRGNAVRWGKKSQPSQVTQDVASIANATSASQTSQGVAKIANIADNVNDNDNVSQESKDSMCDIDIRHPKGCLSQGDAPVIHFAKLCEYFNEKIAEHGSAIGRIKGINGERQKAVRARIREYGKEAFGTVVEKAATSAFLNGRNNKNFIATFDWLVRPTNFPKVLEGNYDDSRLIHATDRQSYTEQLEADARQRLEGYAAVAASFRSRAAADEVREEE